MITTVSWRAARWRRFPKYDEYRPFRLDAERVGPESRQVCNEVSPRSRCDVEVVRAFHVCRHSEAIPVRLAYQIRRQRRVESMAIAVRPRQARDAILGIDERQLDEVGLLLLNARRPDPIDVSGERTG